MHQSATIVTPPLGVVILLVAVHVHHLDKGLCLLKGFELEGLGEGHGSISLDLLGPAGITRSILDSINLIGIHLNQLRFAQFVEGSMLIMDFFQELVISSESIVELGRQILLSCNWYQQVRREIHS